MRPGLLLIAPVLLVACFDPFVEECDDSEAADCAGEERPDYLGREGIHFVQAVIEDGRVPAVLDFEVEALFAEHGVPEGAEPDLPLVPVLIEEYEALEAGAAWCAGSLALDVARTRVQDAAEQLDDAAATLQAPDAATRTLDEEALLLWTLDHNLSEGLGCVWDA